MRVYITFSGQITQPIAVGFVQAVQNIVNQHHPVELYFMLSSQGGDVDSGFFIHNYLVAIKSNIKVITHNIGAIDSIANVIFISGSERYATQNSSFLFHGVSMNFGAPQSRNQLKEALSRMDVMHDRISLTLSQHTNLTVDKLNELFNQGESKNVQYALDNGVIHEIKDPIITEGALHFTLNIK